MVKSMANKVMRLGRTTIFTVGLALLIGLAVGLGSAVLAGNGDPLLLGRANTASGVTRLAGTQGVDGPMLRITNNNAGANDTALDVRVDAGEPPILVNSSPRVSNLNADLVDGFHAGCATGQRLIAGLCYDENPQPANTVSNAADDCHRLGGQLPMALQIRAIRGESGINLGTNATGHWSANITFVGTATPPNDLFAIVVFDSGGVQLVDDQELRPFRCVYQPLTPA
jgi:hypothetical protein